MVVEIGDDDDGARGAVVVGCAGCAVVVDVGCARIYGDTEVSADVDNAAAADGAREEAAGIEGEPFPPASSTILLSIIAQALRILSISPTIVTQRSGNDDIESFVHFCEI